MHSTFFIKMVDDASWLYVEEQRHRPEMHWLLSLWGGYKISPRFQGEVRLASAGANGPGFEENPGGLAFVSRLREESVERSFSCSGSWLYLMPSLPLCWSSKSSGVVVQHSMRRTEGFEISLEVDLTSSGLGLFGWCSS